MDATTGQLRWVLDVTRYPTNRTFEDKNVSAGIDAKIQYYENSQKAQVTITYAAEYADDTARLTGLSFGPVGVSWSNSAEYTKPWGAAWEARVQSITTLE